MSYANACDVPADIAIQYDGPCGAPCGALVCAPGAVALDTTPDDGDVCPDACVAGCIDPVGGPISAPVGWQECDINGDGCVDSYEPNWVTCPGAAGGGGSSGDCVIPVVRDGRVSFEPC